MIINRSLGAWTVLALACLATGAEAQQQQPADTVEGKLVSLEEKGRNKLLTIENADGEQQEFLLSRRVELQVTAPGDDGFLAPKQYVEASAVASNNNLFAKEFMVTVNPQGRIPPARAVKARPKPGQSVNAYRVAGEIAALEETDSDYQLLHLRVAGTKTLPIYVEKNHKVTVRVTDLELVEPDQKVTLKGRAVGKRFIPTAAMIELKKPLKSEDLLGAAEEERR